MTGASLPDPNAQVRPPAKRPCPTCPYRRDVPPGVWAPEEYGKLAAYDAPTHAQPTGVFLCHLDAGCPRVCSGWAGCHDGDELLALRLAPLTGTMSGADVEHTRAYRSPVALFDSGAQAAAHGMRGCGDRPPAAAAAIGKIEKVRGWRR